MAKTRFRPGDPTAAHERFERVKARALKRVDDEFRQIKRLKAVEPPESRPGRPKSGKPN
jgi:hypothetical protein